MKTNMFFIAITVIVVFGALRMYVGREELLMFGAGSLFGVLITFLSIQFGFGGNNA